MKLSLVGLGQVGRGVIEAAKAHPGVQITSIFSRRAVPGMRFCDIPVYSTGDLFYKKDPAEVFLLTMGSVDDLPVWGPKIAARACTVDTYDCHAEFPSYRAAMQKAAEESGHLSLIGGGWDPGLLSLARVYGASLLPGNTPMTFWGPGVSQGHSEAVRHLPGVLDAKQYTLPQRAALRRAKRDTRSYVSAQSRHRRLVYILPKGRADLHQIEKAVRTMPHYFEGYDTTVRFVTQKALCRRKKREKHRGQVWISQKNDGFSVRGCVSLQTSSNPILTGHCMLMFAEALLHMREKGCVGCLTPLDIPPSLLCGGGNLSLL